MKLIVHNLDMTSNKFIVKYDDTFVLSFDGSTPLTEIVKQFNQLKKDKHNATT